MRELSGAIFRKAPFDCTARRALERYASGIASVFRITLGMRVEELTSGVPEGRTRQVRSPGASGVRRHGNQLRPGRSQARGRGHWTRCHLIWNGGLMALTKSKKHYIGITWATADTKGGFAMQCDKNDLSRHS